MREDILYIWLSLVSGIGPVLGTMLLKYFDEIEKVYNATYEDLLMVDGIGVKLAKVIVNSKDISKAEKIYDYCKSENIMILKKGTKFYPKKLNKFDKAPILLYGKGHFREFSSTVAIVGSRRCTDYGKEVTLDISENLAKNNIAIVSGLAKGIDGYAHTGAVKNGGYTIAVIGTGIDICYPKEHKSLEDEIIKSGLIISQFPPGTKNVKQNFIRRNETVAMLSDKIVVVQASERSGAIYTAECGRRYDKEVFVVPNNIYDNFSLGSNKLLADGAKVYINHSSIISNLQVNDHDIKSNRNNIDIDTEMNITQKNIYEIIKRKSSSIDRIKLLMKGEWQDIEEELFELELQGKVRQVAGLFMIC